MEWWSLWNLKLQAPNYKQISNSNIGPPDSPPCGRVPSFNDQNTKQVWNFEFWSLWFVWYLLFVIWNFYSFSPPKQFAIFTSKAIQLLEVSPTEITLYTFTTWLPGKNHFSTRKRNPTHMPLSYRAEQDGWFPVFLQPECGCYRFFPKPSEWAFFPASG